MEREDLFGRIFKATTKGKTPGMQGVGRDVREGPVPSLAFSSVVLISQFSICAYLVNDMLILINVKEHWRPISGGGDQPPPEPGAMLSGFN